MDTVPPACCTFQVCVTFQLWELWTWGHSGICGIANLLLTTSYSCRNLLLSFHRFRQPSASKSLAKGFCVFQSPVNPTDIYVFNCRSGDRTSTPVPGWNFINIYTSNTGHAVYIYIYAVATSFTTYNGAVTFGRSEKALQFKDSRAQHAEQGECPA